MLVGILVNELGSINLISKPLSLEPLFITINISITLICGLSYFINKKKTDYAGIGYTDTNGLKFWAILPHFILPLLGVIGVLCVLVFQSNIILISTLIAVLIVFLLSFSSSKLSSHYPLIILSIALTLLLSTTLISRYMYGPDIGFEFNGFMATKNMSFWNRQDYTNYDQYSSISMASVTVLPTIYANLLNLDGGWVFKIVFAIILSLVPLGLYQLYQAQWGKKIAFAAVFFFMSNYVFFQVLVMVGKQMVAELFYVLLFLIILREGVKYRSNWVIMLFLFFGLIVSHYGTNYIFVFIICMTFIIGKIFFKKKKLKMKSTIIVTSLCLTFLWYLNVVQGPFEKLVNVVRSTFENLLPEFLLAQSRGKSVQSALGIIEAPSTLHTAGTIIFNLAMVLLVLGFLYLILKWRRGQADSDYALITSLNMILLLSAIIVPRFAGFLEMGRLFQIVIIFLSPLFVLGAKFLCENVSKIIKKSSSGLKRVNKTKSYFLLLAAIILVPFFLFQTGVIYELAGDPLPSSISISKYKLEDSIDLIHESDVFSANWLSRYGAVKSTLTYSDTISLLYVLTSYSTIDRSMISIFSNETTEREVYIGVFSFAIQEVANPKQAYIYLRQYNVKHGLVVYNPKTDTQYEVSELPILNSTEAFINKIYSNSASEIYYRNP
jgi:uncharacterized membrane protein